MLHIMNILDRAWPGFAIVLKAITPEDVSSRAQLSFATAGSAFPYFYLYFIEPHTTVMPTILLA